MNWIKTKQKYPKIFYMFIRDKQLNPKMLTFEYLENNICFCDIKKFSENNGIIINIVHYDDWGWTYILDIKENNVHERGFKTRPEAEEKASEKTFEILEDEI